ncbi:MAG: hypothetical protein COX62_03105 [Deltaproteobacteria bacterium CG_4_10_14_0_2_um_filter_43_8]|nr:MAG: hypothetical protein COV43_03925 [Deltaproteobacteria bacterium CG11_big_fil_rev_8_21_14_0_20_42_23]PJA21172.1 MAG: hypothetical protein COX62_03105 [Deltaproteobacteria bacterium CG_4_10_14_0_2_um_filter_43_8]PJC63384.1 MAG: hypothetical protein CO021_09895 [Deltaproteobacteria bacterium CG_4_9_14_0_2_um_filter_42_21]
MTHITPAAATLPPMLQSFATALVQQPRFADSRFAQGVRVEGIRSHKKHTITMDYNGARQEKNPLVADMANALRLSLKQYRAADEAQCPLNASPARQRDIAKALTPIRYTFTFPDTTSTGILQLSHDLDSLDFRALRSAELTLESGKFFFGISTPQTLQVDLDFGNVWFENADPFGVLRLLKAQLEGVLKRTLEPKSTVPRKGPLSGGGSGFWGEGYL